MKIRFAIGWILAAWGLAVAGTPAHAGPRLDAGPYTVTITTDPAVIPDSGRAQLRLQVRDRAGLPVTGAQVTTLTAMPGMPMGEREESATADPGQPGTYGAPASFPMAGKYHITVKVSAAAGTGSGSVDVSTGQDTAEAGPSPWRLVFWLLLVAFLGYVAVSLWRARQAGWRPDLRWTRKSGVLTGMVLLVAMFALSAYAVKHWRRRGAMTPIEAQALDMSHMPAPVGHVAVTLAKVERGPVAATVRYTGTAVGYVEQDIYPRVQGWITWMPFYAGDRVRKGQLLARLDSTELETRVQEREAAQRMAEHQAMIAQQGYRQSLAEAERAKADIASKRGMLEDARQQKRRAEGMVKQARNEVVQARNQVAEARETLAAAQAERAEADADRAAAQTMLADAEAQVTAARADQTYMAAELQRSEKLLAQGVIALAEFQKDRAAAQNATSKRDQAEARVRQVNEQIRAAEAKLGKAAAMERAANARIAQMQAAFEANQAKIEQATAEVAAAEGRITQAEADVEAASAAARAVGAAAEGAQHQVEHSQAGIGEASAAVAREKTVKGYTEIRSLVDGVITARNISPGVLVGPGQSILKVAQTRPIRIQANVPEADLARIRPGSRVRIRSRKPGVPDATASVTAVFPAVDPVARTGIVEALLPNAGDRFLPGQFVDVEITLAERASALRVPTPAIAWQTAPSPFGQSGTQQASVWVAEATAEVHEPMYYCPMHLEVRSQKPGLCPKCKMTLVPESVGGDWKARRVNVAVGITDGRYSEILSGVPDRAFVVTSGQQNLHDGDALSPTNMPPATEAGAPAPAAAPAAETAGLGRYYCPMHPEVTSDDPNAKCPKCGMKLVPRPATTSPAPHPAAPAHSSAPARPAAAGGKYYCPMHPEVTSNDPNATCPKCGGMTLMPRPGAK